MTTWIPPMHSRDVVRAFVWTLRDVADEDYIAARQSLRLHLVGPYLWSAQQAFEKYLKCIGALNGLPVKPAPGHHLIKPFRDRKGREQQAVLGLLKSFLPFRMQLSDRTLKFLEVLDEMALYRYGQSSRGMAGVDLVELDYAVWDVRRYAQPLFVFCPDLIRQLPDQDQRCKLWREMAVGELDENLKKIEAAKESLPITYQISGGHLENILSGRSADMAEARKALIWQNACFGSRSRKTVRVSSNTLSKFSPLGFLDVLDEYRKYVRVEDELVDKYRRQNSLELP